MGQLEVVCDRATTSCSLIDWHGASHFECVKWSINCWIWFRFRSRHTLARNSMFASSHVVVSDDRYANFGWLLAPLKANTRFGDWNDHWNVNKVTSLLAKWMFREMFSLRIQKPEFVYLFYEFLMISRSMSSCWRPRFFGERTFACISRPVILSRVALPPMWNLNLETHTLLRGSFLSMQMENERK